MRKLFFSIIITVTCTSPKSGIASLVYLSTVCSDINGRKVEFSELPGLYKYKCALFHAGNANHMLSCKMPDCSFNFF